jgi:retinol dehydrogenase 12
VNWIGGFYLQRLLEEPLASAGAPSDPARVVVVASNAHTIVSRDDVTDDDFGLHATPERRAAYGLANLMPTYARSKLLNILHARRAAQRFAEAGKGVIAIALHPGFILTNLPSGSIDQSFPPAWRPLVKALVRWAFTLLGAMDEEDGAITSLYAATAFEAASLNGAYLVPFARQWPGTALSQDAALTERAWNVAEAAISSWPLTSV